MFKSHSRYPTKPSSVPKQRLNIHISDQGDTSESEQSYTDDEGSSDVVDVSPPSVTGSIGEWAHLSYPDEIGSSEASHPRTSRHSRDRETLPASRSRSSHRYSRRDVRPQREAFQQRAARRHRSPESPDSESAEDLVEDYTRHRPERRGWPPTGAAAVGGYAQSASSGPSYNVFPNGAAGHPHFPHAGPVLPPSDQLVRFGPLAHMGRSGQYGNTSPPYGYGGSHFPPPHAGGMPPFFGHDQLPGHPGPHPAHLPPHQPHDRSRGQSPPEVPPLPHMVPPHGNPHFGGPPFGSPDLIPYGANGYMPFNPNFPPMPPGMLAHPLFNQIPRQPESPSATSQSDTAKDEAIARLEKLILDERAEREARDAAREAAIAKAAADKLAAEERAAAEKKIADEAAANARAAALAEAEQKAAEAAIAAQKAAKELAAAAAADAKKAAEEAAAAAAEEAKKAADEAAAAAAAAAAAEATKVAEEAAKAAAKKPPPEKKKPIKFKDAVGRKFNFPFHLCATWQGMEELIRQAFLHVDVIGPHVAEGHYDLVGPSGDIILPQVWETVIEPDWTITMHMWPIPEKPKEPDPPPPAEEPPAPPPEEPKKPAAPAPKKPKVRPEAGSFAMWMMGNNRPKPKQPLKA
ncbi:conserved hypothetical protein [Talaromyces stipitatus ATCC 10500]|uniref:Ubiquitin-like domain-containing protein n=1 Tax=Talaromyces stipitatus (strain ATCC 10500 / CBS 375.48 / QM 6759 / NRRL 1006) TaxID=441959 RepID=B8M0Y0_TALSN|nr:uncharacterized protein TSTA_089990 [Talaromyces stipitatus ATCC 10500]EED21760.1 conserved hypothetical protein [Talaromyces stipitatus ATCC 10500]